jgi:hypothetical protein
MAGSISINPAQVTNALGAFSVRSQGYVQGTTLDNSVSRYYLAQGVVNPSATAPMWGGSGITDSLPTPGTEAAALGSVLALATSASNLTGFTVFDQATAMIQSPQSPAPLAAAGMSINFYRFGSGARIAVACSNATATTLESSASNVPLYWDYVNQVLLASPGGTAIAAKLVGVNIGNSLVVAYSSATGFATWTTNGSTAIIEI